MQKLFDKNRECLCYFNFGIPHKEEISNHNYEIEWTLDFCDCDGTLIDRGSIPQLKDELLFIEEIHIGTDRYTFQDINKYVLSSLSDYDKRERFSNLIIVNSLNSEIWGHQGYYLDRVNHKYEWINENILIIDRNPEKDSFITRPQFYEERVFCHLIIKDDINWHCYIGLWCNEKYMLLAKNYADKDNSRDFKEEERIVLYSIEDNAIIWETKGFFLLLNNRNPDYIDICLKEEVDRGKMVLFSVYRLENGSVTCVNRQVTKMLETCFFKSPRFFSNGYFRLEKNKSSFIFDSNYKIVLVLNEKHNDIRVKTDENANTYIECDANIDSKWMSISMDMSGQYIDARYPAKFRLGNYYVYRKYQDVDSRKRWKEGIFNKDTEIIPIIYDGIYMIDFGEKKFYEVRLDVGNNQILKGLYRDNELLTDLVDENEFFFKRLSHWDIKRKGLNIGGTSIPLANYPDHQMFIPKNDHYAILRCKNNAQILIDGEIKSDLVIDNASFIPYYEHVPSESNCICEEHIAFSIKTENGRKIGIINQEGIIVIPAQYDNIFAYGDILLADNDIYHYSSEKIFKKIFELTSDELIGWKYDNLILLSSQTNHVYAYNLFDKTITHPIDNELLAKEEYQSIRANIIHYFDCEKRIFSTKKKVVAINKTTISHNYREELESDSEDSYSDWQREIDQMNRDFWNDCGESSSNCESGPGWG